MGTWWSLLSLFLYGNIFYCKVISIQHETNHETYFKTRGLNKFVYHITSLLGGFEAVRWKWSHFHHHTHTIFTHEEVYDYENNSPRPTEPIRFLLNFLPLGPIINIQKVRHFTHFEIIKHSLGIISSVVKITVPQNEINKVVNSSRFYVLFWFLVIIISVLFGSWLPIIMILLPPFYGNTILMICAMTQHAGLKDNIKRVIPNNLCAEIDLSKISTLKIFKWLKHSGIKENEMLKTFNCGVGFCLIINKKNLQKVKKCFSRRFQPYVIGKISKNTKSVKINGKIKW